MRSFELNMIKYNLYYYITHVSIRVLYGAKIIYVNAANLFHLNFQPLQIMCRHRDPQVVENYPDLFNLWPNIYKSLCLSSYLISNDCD